MSGYIEAIEAAGYAVRDYKEFGSYQGTWIAILENGNFIEGSYGSCSGCDAFQAEFDYYDTPSEIDGKYYKTGRTWDEDDECTKEEYIECLEKYKNKLSDFGKSYTDSTETKEEIVARYKRKCEGDYVWDDDKEILEWLEAQ